MFEKNDLELKLRIVKGEIRENKREADKFQNTWISLFISSVGSFGGGFYMFFKQRHEHWWIISAYGWFFILGFLSALLGLYWYNKYKSACQKIEQLEKELNLLKKGLKEE